MITLGSIAPRFGCSAWSDGHVRRLSWPALHTGTLLLLFDAQAARVRQELYELNQAAIRLGALRANAAVVCRGPLHMIERWAADTLAQHEPLALTVIVDPEDHLAALYDLVSQEGAACWGQFIIDSAGIVRQVETCRCHIAANADELVRFVRDIANDNIEDHKHFEEDKWRPKSKAQ
jgi:alkyl hydroperoxide reductase subunit AhpC